LYVSGCTLAHPFYINDICFAGMVGDLRQLTATPVAYWIKYTRLAPEQLIWGSSTLRLNPIFDSYFRANIALIFNDVENIGHSIAAMKGSGLYHKALAGYIHLLSNAFSYIHGDADHDEMAHACRRHTLEQMLWTDVDLPWINLHPSSLTAHAGDVSVARVLAAGEFAGSEFGDNVLAALRDIESRAPNTVVPRSETDSLIKEARQLADAFEKTTNVHGFRVFRENGNERSVGGMKPQWRLIGERTARENELEDQVSHLRRLVDSLNDQLRDGTPKPKT
jgi:hypothetical protein